MKKLSKISSKKNNFDKNYFHKGGYKNVDFDKKFTMYWWSCRFYASLIKSFCKRGSVLDIGCGLGHVLSRLDSRYQTFGVDLNEWAIEKAKAVSPKTKFKVLEAEKIESLTTCYDLVLMRHVVEHLKDPFAVIKKVTKIIKKDGFLILATPNPDNPASRLLGNKWFAFQDPTHISIKSPKDWYSILENENFSLLLKTTDGFWAAPYIPIIPTVVQKIIFGFLGGMQTIFCFVFLPENWGEDLIIVARKN